MPRRIVQRPPTLPTLFAGQVLDSEELLQTGIPVLLVDLRSCLDLDCGILPEETPGIILNASIYSLLNEVVANYVEECRIVLLCPTSIRFHDQHGNQFYRKTIFDRHFYFSADKISDDVVLSRMLIIPFDSDSQDQLIDSLERMLKVRASNWMLISDDDGLLTQFKQADLKTLPLATAGKLDEKEVDHCNLLLQKRDFVKGRELHIFCDIDDTLVLIPNSVLQDKLVFNPSVIGWVTYCHELCARSNTKIKISLLTARSDPVDDAEILRLNIKRLEKFDQTQPESKKKISVMRNRLEIIEKKQCCPLSIENIVKALKDKLPWSQDIEVICTTLRLDGMDDLYMLWKEQRLAAVANKTSMPLLIDDNVDQYEESKEASDEDADRLPPIKCYRQAEVPVDGVDQIIQFIEAILLNAAADTDVVAPLLPGSRL